MRLLKTSKCLFSGKNENISYITWNVTLKGGVCLVNCLEELQQRERKSVCSLPFSLL